MPTANIGDVQINYRVDGDPNGAPIVFSNALGTDLRLWDAVLPHLPEGLRIIRYDTRGHGQSSVPEGPYTMGALVRDAERLLDHLNIRDCVFVGLSLGGQIAQGLAVKRLDQVRALVLSNTAAKIGVPSFWDKRVEIIRKGGIEALMDTTTQRWFSRQFRAHSGHLPWRDMMIGQPVGGYLGCCAAMSGTDFYTPTSGLRLPTLGIAGNEDGETPADLMRETIDLIPGARFELMRRAGHLPCVEHPIEYAALLRGFLTETGHI